MTPADAGSAQTPLLSPEEKELPCSSGGKAAPSDVTSNEQELQFYDPSAALSISREVAFGYLILLTGGTVQYEPPTMEEVMKPQDQTGEQSKETKANKKTSLPTLDEESASLAYAAIVDGNVLHTCFGLKATASGGSSNAAPTLGDKNNQSSSILCCFPNSSATLDALQLVLPQTTKNKLRMKDLVEILREIMDLHYETAGAREGDVSGNTSPVFMKVIHAYTQFFTSIVRYHDSKKHIQSYSKEDENKTDGIFTTCMIRLNRLFSTPKINPQLEKMQQNTLKDIERGFHGLKEDIGNSLERAAAQTAFTGCTSFEE